MQASRRIPAYGLAMNRRPPEQGCADFRRAFQTSRRGLLQIGASALMPCGAASLLRASGQASPHRGDPAFGRAKRCIMLFMWGGPSQLETFDLKPDAPEEVRGEFSPISTSVPGLQIGEHFQILASRMDRVAVVRSLSHTDPAHLSSGHATLTGHLAPVVNSDADAPSGRDTPVIGSVISRLAPTDGSLPSAVTLPWLAYHPAAPGGQAPGQHGGWLGRKYDPFLVQGDPNAADWAIPELTLPDGLDVARLSDRRRLLQIVDAQARDLATGAEAGKMTSYQQQAFDLIASPDAKTAFDVAAEPEAVRERYGRNIHGQCVLLARRLVERGVPLVCVNWHNDGQNFWDTHGNNFNRLKNDLIPPADRALSALLDDLVDRGMLDDTIVCWVGEFGRRPQITKNNAGREHWPNCYSGLLAGAGVTGGAIHGESDAHAAYPTRDPVSPQDYLATVYYALGVDPEQKLPDQFGRPLSFCEGRPLRSLLG